MAKKPPEKKPSTWRDLNAASAKKRRKIPLSLRAKLRVAWLWIRAIALIAIVGALGYGAYYLYENTFFEEIFSAKSGEVKRVEFKTDGLITAKWLADFVNIPKNAKLNEVDIFAIKNALTALPQVESAAVERAYPDAIKITLVEYKPFMKLFTQVSGKQRIFIMTLGGKFFEPLPGPAQRTAGRGHPGRLQVFQHRQRSLEARLFGQRSRGLQGGGESRGIFGGGVQIRTAGGSGLEENRRVRAREPHAPANLRAHRLGHGNRLRPQGLQKTVRAA